MSDTLLIRNVAVDAEPGLDVRVGKETVLAVGASLHRRRYEPVLDGFGGAIIPGLHDHHIHLRAAVAARESVDVSEATSPADFDRTVTFAAAAAEGRWVRVIGWHESAAGALNRYRLDALAGPVPVRVQHRSGAMWVLNSAAIRQTGIDDGDRPEGVERDERGVATGRLLRLDAWLRGRLTAAATSSFASGMARYAVHAARLGITGFTEATPDRDEADAAEFALLSSSGLLPQRLILMAPARLAAPTTARVKLGPRKVILDDSALPGIDDLAPMISTAHQAGSAVALHCVTAEQLVVAVASLEAAGTRDGDRIEHAAVVPPGYAAKLARLGVAVVTQPGFISCRGDNYRRQVEPAEQDWLYPCASLLEAGVTVAAGTDAPFGPCDPWRNIAAATTRRTRAGQVLNRAERVSPRRALELFLAVPDDLRNCRTVAPGQLSDLCVLRASEREALAEPSSAVVLMTIMGTQHFDGNDHG